MTYASLDGDVRTPFPEMVVIPFADAAEQDWDVTMVPGAGGAVYPDRCGELAVLQDPRFGLRVQHVMGAPDRFDHFAAVIEHVQPHLVTFVDPRWSDRLQERLSPGVPRLMLIDGVDTDRFRPCRPLGTRVDQSCWVIGGSARKRPLPVLAACHRARELCGQPVRLELYGPVDKDSADELHAAEATGEVRLHGPLYDDALPTFYHGLDVFVDLQDTSGWRSGVAEAAASGVPSVATEHGLVAINRHGDAVAVVRDEVEEIGRAIAKLLIDDARRTALARAALEAVQPYSWEIYTRTLLHKLQQVPAYRGPTVPPW